MNANDYLGPDQFNFLLLGFTGHIIGL